MTGTAARKTGEENVNLNEEPRSHSLCDVLWEWFQTDEILTRGLRGRGGRGTVAVDVGGGLLGIAKRRSDQHWVLRSLGRPHVSSVAKSVSSRGQAPLNLGSLGAPAQQ